MSLRIHRLLTISLLLAAVLPTTGCKPATAEVASKSALVVSTATDIRTDADEGRGLTQTGAAQTEDPTARQYLDASNELFTGIGQKADTIVKAGGVIQEQVPKLQDKTPAWVMWLKTIGIVALTVLVGLIVFVFWNSGLSRLVAAILGRFSSRLESQAKLDFEALEAAKQAGDSATLQAMSSAITLKRSQPAYSVAFELAKRRAKLKA